MNDAITLEIRQPGCEPQVHEIRPGVYPVGSENGNKIVVPDSDVEKRHAILILKEDGFSIEDLNSRKGSFLEESRIHGRIAFRPGQKIRLGSCVLIVKGGHEPPALENKPELPPPLRQRIESAAATQDGLRQEQKRQIKKQIHKELLERLDIKRLTAAHVKEEDLHQRALQMIGEIVKDVVNRLPAWLSPDALIKEIYDETVGLGPLEDLLADPEITEIMVNRNDQIYIEKRGRLVPCDRVFMDDSSVLAIIERIVAPIGRRIDESQPYVDARLKDGSRVNAIIPPLALNGPCITIRKFSKEPLTVENLIGFNSMSPGMAEFFRICVMLRKNIVVSGGTGSGKTTFLNVMSSFIPPEDRIVTIEDSAELRLTQSHVVRLESRPPNIEGRGAITIRDLLRNALRMRPDRLIIGECRGGESLDMLQAMNTGHDGSLTTVHANSPRDVIARLETMVLMSGVDLPARAIREQIASAVHLIIHTARLSDGSRKVTWVSEVSGLEGDRITMQDIFSFVQTGINENEKVEGYFTASGSVPTFLEQIKTRGLSIDMGMFEPR